MIIAVDRFHTRAKPFFPFFLALYIKNVQMLISLMLIKFHKTDVEKSVYSSKLDTNVKRVAYHDYVKLCIFLRNITVNLIISFI